MRQKVRSASGKAEKWLLERLGKAITKRRQFLRYAREHSDKIARPSAKPYVPSTVPDLQPHRGPRREDEALFERTDAPTEYSRPSAITKASTLGPVNIEEAEEAFEDDRSISTVATSAYEESSPNDIRIARLEDVTTPGQHFQCPYCRATQAFKRQSSWKKHVLADLRAYLCTFEECGMLMFETKTAWIAHETEKHRRCWICPLCRYQTSRNKNTLAVHITQAHPDTIATMNVEITVDTGSQAQDSINASDCKLCDWTSNLMSTSENSQIDSRAVMYVSPRDYYRHVARHLEQLALFAVPREVTDTGDIDSALTGGAIGGDLVSFAEAKVSRRSLGQLLTLLLIPVLKARKRNLQI